MSQNCVDGLNSLPGRISKVPLGQKELLLTLFRAFEEYGICYCVLHSWGALPDELPSDLDVAIHPSDSAKLIDVLGTVQEAGYEVVQCLNYAVGGYCFVIFWFEGCVPRSVAIDVIFEDRRSGLILCSGEKLVACRRQEKMFWVPDPLVEFQYLLAKKTLKGSVPDDQGKRLKVLAEELGRVRAGVIAGTLFGKVWQRPIVDACADGSIRDLLKRLRGTLWRTAFSRNPLLPIRNLFGEASLRIRRWFQYTGIFIAILGPDGVGKSTLVEGLTTVLGPTFRRHRVFHWRPESFARRHSRDPVIDPHRFTARPLGQSVIILFALLLDYWLGYWSIIRPLLARSDLVLFDRYYYDLLIDSKRYRYGGPRWLAKFVGRLIPKPDLILILDAPEQVTLSRKQEVTCEELQRQRNRYLRWSKGRSSARVIGAADAQPLVLERTMRAILAHMKNRLRKRHPFRPHNKPKAGLTSIPDSKNGYSSREGALSGALDQFALESPNRIATSEEEVSSATSCETPIRVSAKRMVQPEWGVPGDTNAHRHQFVVLPSCKRPRWLLPLGDCKRTRQGLEIYSPYALTARLLKSFLSRAIDMGWQGWASSKVSISSEVPIALETLVHEVTGEANPSFALSLGTPGRFRKLVVQVMRPSGEILGYIKLPLAQEATERVRGEAKILQHLCHSDALHPHIPRVLYAGEWGDGYILFQSFQANNPGPVEFGTLHDEFLRALWSVHRTTRCGQDLVDQVRLEWSKAEPHLPPGWRELAERVFDRSIRDLVGETIACGLWHGDFAPWNTRSGNGPLLVFDWECAATDVPNLWDAFHFHVQLNSLLHRRNRTDLSVARSAVERASFLLFVLNSVCRLIDEQADCGNALMYRQRLLLKELSRAEKESRTASF